MSDIVVARLTIPSDDLELGRILHDDGDVRIELAQFVPTGTTVFPFFWAETCDRQAFEANVRNDERVRAIERIGDGSDRSLYRIAWDANLDGFLRAVGEHDIVVEQAAGTPEEWQFQVCGSDRERISSFRETLLDQEISSTVTGVWRPTEPAATPYGLTEKQREAIEVAFSGSYFSVPSETNLSDLAERVGISRQAFSRRLDRGLYRLIENTLAIHTGTPA